ncbi:hypothetical protein BN7_2957 [Wickerhamomyces ciferrii]|uniref:Uncharacterized protein n=1 Tax=Wickerhamomyces ciferrii (strain ATCC 14091 / BCRC 22168 / CBS 111 / JCM 3599 / NBRC 0793 / NRRL Y-1031 F-60-10) TaxID=1206466 RepID=K0KPS5_WICCF|nr:uncharacterized protein BN7_2957 [Wickerhamomyces ciferrii]CCH43409.1 hypothetical protein BN7_2957 [Wickerhamomyces ciferrii]
MSTATASEEIDLGEDYYNIFDITESQIIIFEFFKYCHIKHKIFNVSEIDFTLFEKFLYDTSRTSFKSDVDNGLPEKERKLKIRNRRKDFIKNQKLMFKSVNIQLGTIIKFSSENESINENESIDERTDQQKVYLVDTEKLKSFTNLNFKQVFLNFLKSRSKISNYYFTNGSKQYRLKIELVSYLQNILRSREGNNYLKNSEIIVNFSFDKIIHLLNLLYVNEIKENENNNEIEHEQSSNTNQLESGDVEMSIEKIIHNEEVTDLQNKDLAELKNKELELIVSQHVQEANVILGSTTNTPSSVDNVNATNSITKKNHHNEELVTDTESQNNGVIAADLAELKNKELEIIPQHVKEANVIIGSATSNTPKSVNNEKFRAETDELTEVKTGTSNKRSLKDQVDYKKKLQKTVPVPKPLPSFVTATTKASRQRDLENARRRNK